MLPAIGRLIAIVKILDGKKTKPKNEKDRTAGGGCSPVIIPGSSWEEDA
jgi:hypothetical protein